MRLLLMILASFSWAQNEERPYGQHVGPGQEPDFTSQNNASINYTNTQISKMYRGRPVLTGRPDFIGGIRVSSITFQDGTTQNTAATSGGVTTTSSPTFTTPVTFSTADYHSNLWMGTASVNISTSVGIGGVEVLFVDNATQSSGCVVGMSFDTTRNQWVATSTTTDFTGLSGVYAGVLYEPSVPNTIVKVITRGPVRVATAVSNTLTQSVTTSSTRCQSTNNALSSAACNNNHCLCGYATTVASPGVIQAMCAGP